MTRRPPRSPLFPYTPLFRSLPYPPRPSPLMPDPLGRKVTSVTAPLNPSSALCASLRASSPLGSRLIRRSKSLRSEEHTSELQSLAYLVCRLLLEKKKQTHHN